MIDNNAAAETHYEQFVEYCHKDETLDLIVWENFSNFAEYRNWKRGLYVERPYQEAFEAGYDWDGEYFVFDPKECLIVYLARDRKDKIDKLSEKTD